MKDFPAALGVLIAIFSSIAVLFFVWCVFWRESERANVVGIAKLGYWHYILKTLSLVFFISVVVVSFGMVGYVWAIQFYDFGGGSKEYCIRFEAIPHQNGTALNVRSEPSLNSRIIAELKAGDTFWGADQVANDQWYPIRLKMGNSQYLEGFVFMTRVRRYDGFSFRCK